MVSSERPKFLCKESHTYTHIPYPYACMYTRVCVYTHIYLKKKKDRKICPKTIQTQGMKQPKN